MFSIFLYLFQDPAGIFELIEVVGNGTYGQVYKVSEFIYIPSIILLAVIYLPILWLFSCLNFARVKFLRLSFHKQIFAERAMISDSF